MKIWSVIAGAFLLISILSGCVFYGGYHRPYPRSPQYHHYSDYDHHDRYDRHDRDRDRRW